MAARDVEGGAVVAAWRGAARARHAPAGAGATARAGDGGGNGTGMDAMKLRNIFLWLCVLASPALAQEKPSTAGPGVQPLSAPMAMPGLGRERGVRVYLPPGYATSKKRYAVLYMHDAQNLFDDRTSFVGEWGVDEALDQLAREQGLELIVVGIDHGGEHRINELKPWDDPKYGKGEAADYLRFVVEVVKPWVDAHYRTRRDRAHTGIMGSSLGGLTSWYAAFTYPKVFGRIGVFSPSYWIAPQSYELARTGKLPSGMRMYQMTGGREGEKQDSEETVANSTRMEAVLRQDQPKLQLLSVVRPEGEHNERSWRREFPAAVQYLFGKH
jgi:predicted alpha/beta superfamily hydrolase